jgi:hypothetical protein
MMNTTERDTTMSSTRNWTALLSGLTLTGIALIGIASTSQAQGVERRVSFEARGGLYVPTFDISDAVDAGPSVGLGAAVRFGPKLWLMGDVDLGFHSGADLDDGGEAADVKVYHYVAKLDQKASGTTAKRVARVVPGAQPVTGSSLRPGEAPAMHSSERTSSI